VTPYDPAAQSMLEQLRQGFIARGSDSVIALEQAYAALGGMVQRQGYLLSFVHVFQLLAIIFVAVVPFHLLMRRPRKR
jgi:DHA2 family multidrug resistance protein